MTGDRPITEDDLQGFVDGVLDDDRREAVRIYLHGHPETAVRIAAYQDQAEALRAGLARFADRPLPPELGVRALVEQRRGRMIRRRNIAAAAAILCVGGLTGWFGHQVTATPTHGVHALAREAVDNYEVYAADARRPVEMAADQRATLVHWVSERLGAPVEAPDLGAAGYRFLGGRLVTTPNGPAALFVYEGQAADRLTVTVRPMAVERNEAMSERSFGELGGVTWSADGLGFSVVAPRGSGPLRPLANEVRRQARSV